LTFSHQLSEKTYNTVSVSVVDQDYDNISTTTLEEERSGTKTAFQTAILHRINERATGRFAAGYEFKSAGLDSINYKFDKDVYLNGGGNVRRLNYDGGFVENTPGLDETRVVGRVALGKYLNSGNSIFSEKTDRATKAIEIGFNWNRRGSNLSDETFENFGVDLRFSVGL